MPEKGRLLEKWRMDEAEVRRRMYRAPTPRERERWHAVWLLAQSLPRAATRGVDGGGGGPSLGAGCPYGWPMGPSLRGGAVPKGWFLSRLVVPPALDVERRADPVSSTG